MILVVFFIERFQRGSFMICQDRHFHLEFIIVCYSLQIDKSFVVRMMSFFHSCFICIHVLFHLLSKMFYTYTYARILNSIKIMNDFSEMIHSLVAFFKLLHHFFKIYTGIQYLQIPCTFIFIISTSVLNLKYFMINRYL